MMDRVELVVGGLLERELEKDMYRAGDTHVRQRSWRIHRMGSAVAFGHLRGLSDLPIARSAL